MSNVQIGLWFEGQARDGSIRGADQYAEVGAERTGHPAGTEMTVEFEVEGVRVLGLNGGPQFPHTEAISLMVYRDMQEEIDEVWERLLAGGGAESRCGWLKDRFGVSWQVAPSNMGSRWAEPTRWAQHARPRQCSACVSSPSPSCMRPTTVRRRMPDARSRPASRADASRS